MKKCPNCGACQECGHAPSPQPIPNPWFGPRWYPGYPSAPYYGPYWSVTQPEWPSGAQQTFGGSVTVTNTTGPTA